MNIKKKWYENAFVYQIYPRSYCDSNGDGIGDINGIASKLDYIKSLGIDAIWLSPIFESPMDDCGYDISDFYAISSDYGTMEDFDNLLVQAHKRGIRILLDLVVNHTSTEHEWFKKAVDEPQSKYHDYYFWRKKGDFTDKTPPEGSGYGDSVWKYLPQNDEYYLHTGYETQADLNWDNTEVRDEICNMINFWLDKGVDGFRCDVIYLISKEKTLTEFGMGPNLHKYLHMLYKRCFEPHEAITVAEVWEQTPETTLTMIAPEREELTMSFYFDHMGLGREGRFNKKEFSPSEFISKLDIWQRGINDRAVNTLVLENHDQSRIVSRFGNENEYRSESATLLAAMTFFMKGCCYIYQGQELGLVNPKFDSIELIKDVETLDYIADVGGSMSEGELLEKINFGTRDAARVPMPWNNSRYFGFSPAEPWLTADCPYEKTNVEAEEKDEFSTLNLFRKIIKLKKEDEVLSYGDFELLYNVNGVFGYKRSYKGREVFVRGNFSPNQMPALSDSSAQGRIVFSNYPVPESNAGVFRPYEIIVTE